MKSRYSPEFVKSLKYLNVRIRKSLKERLIIFENNPQSSQLNNHALKRE